MKLQGAVIKEQGITFAILIVKENVMHSQHLADEALASARGLFRPHPTVLMSQNYRGRPEFYGRKDIVKFLANVPIETIPWKEYTIN